MHNVLNAIDWDESFGSHKINKLLEFNVLQVIAHRIDLTHMDSSVRQLRQTKIAFFLSKPDQL